MGVDLAWNLKAHLNFHPMNKNVVCYFQQIKICCFKKSEASPNFFFYVHNYTFFQRFSRSTVSKALGKSKRIIIKTLFWFITSQALSENSVGASGVFCPTKNQNLVIFSRLKLLMKQIILLCGKLSILFCYDRQSSDRFIVSRWIFFTNSKIGMTHPIFKQREKMPSIMLILNNSKMKGAKI